MIEPGPYRVSTGEVLGALGEVLATSLGEELGPVVETSQGGAWASNFGEALGDVVKN
jgi:hypothetical protein